MKIFKKWFVLLIVIMFALTSTVPAITHADSTIDQLNKKIKELEKKKSEQTKKIQNNQQKIKELQKKGAELKVEVQKLDLQMAETERKIDDLEKEMEKTIEQARITAQQLDAAILRVQERDHLLKTRVRAMYEQGEISYIEVLLDSKSIGDFLSRLDFVRRIVNSDVNILEENKKDQAEIEQRKAEIEAYYAKLEEQNDELSKLLASLESQKKDKSVAIASLKEQEQELEELNEELEKQLAEIAKQHSDLLKQREKLYYSGGKFQWPVPGSTVITSKFGYRIHPIQKTRKLHSGIDIDGETGDTIVAAEAGEVILAEYYGGFGNTVMISHGGGLVTLYGHIKNGGIKVKVGQEVKRGQKIAEIGSTGLSTGSHLHFSVLKDGTYVDPMKYFGK